jgi:hypothetical protein
MTGAIPPQFAFMAWGSAKKEAQGHLYFCLNFSPGKMNIKTSENS